MCYLEVYCLISIWGLPVIWFIDFWFNSIAVWEQALHDFYSFKFVKVCFMIQNMVYLRECSMWAWEEEFFLIIYNNSGYNIQLYATNLSF